jgi:hypothetical protein
LKDEPRLVGGVGIGISSTKKANSHFSPADNAAVIDKVIGAQTRSISPPQHFSHAITSWPSKVSKKKKKKRLGGRLERSFAT